MSDDDFELLLKVKDSLSFTSKYNPPFVLCNDKLYIFIFFAIKEIDPTQITDLDWSYRRNGIFIEFKAPEKIIFTLPKKVLPHFLQIIEKYTNSKILLLTKYKKMNHTIIPFSKKKMVKLTGIYILITRCAF